jgi:hypothetical protein
MAFAGYTEAVPEFVRQHPNWAAFLVFALAFGDPCCLFRSSFRSEPCVTTRCLSTGGAQLEWPLKNHPALLNRGRAFLKRWACRRSCLLASRAPCARACPLLRESPRSLHISANSNWTSALLWAFVPLSPGTRGLKWEMEYPW